MAAGVALADEDTADQRRADLIQPAPQVLNGPAPGARSTSDDDHAIHTSRDGKRIGCHSRGRRIEQHELISLALALQQLGHRAGIQDRERVRH